MIIRKHYFVNGRVQGVGFRLRAEHIARRWNLTGYAINLDDGRVELEVQGEELLVSKFLDKMNQSLFISIDDVETYNMKVNVSESGFFIDK